MKSRLINNGRLELEEKCMCIFGGVQYGTYKIPYEEILSVEIKYPDLTIGHLTVRLKEKGICLSDKQELPVGEITLYFEQSEKRSIEKLNSELCKKVTELEASLNDVGESVINRLYKLHNLKENGIITEDEFIKKRNQIIESARH